MSGIHVHKTEDTEEQKRNFDALAAEIDRERYTVGFGAVIGLLALLVIAALTTMITTPKARAETVPGALAHLRRRPCRGGTDDPLLAGDLNANVTFDAAEFERFKQETSGMMSTPRTPS
jgi:hypothetical protein